MKSPYDIILKPVLTEKIAEAVHALYDLKRDPWMEGLSEPEIVPCRLGSEANLVGAYLYFRER